MSDGDTTAGETTTGDTNTGDTNTGDTNTGDTNTGDTNTGDTNTGDTNTGDTNTGDTNTGDTNTGDTNTGDAKGVGVTAGSPLTLATRGWLDHLRVERGAADNTLSSYRRDLARYDQFLTARGISDPTAVRESDVTDFLASLREGGPEHA